MAWVEEVERGGEDRNTIPTVPARSLCMFLSLSLSLSLPPVLPSGYTISPTMGLRPILARTDALKAAWSDAAPLPRLNRTTARTAMTAGIMSGNATATARRDSIWARPPVATTSK